MLINIMLIKKNECIANEQIFHEIMKEMFLLCGGRADLSFFIRNDEFCGISVPYINTGKISEKWPYTFFHRKCYCK